MTMDLVTFLRARLDEDEAWALAASTPPEWRGGEVVLTGVHWQWGVGENWDPVERLDPALDEFIGEGMATLMTVEKWPSKNLPGWNAPAYNVNCEEVPTAVGAHIARHDPARVLRDVEAKRRILDRYEDAVARLTDPAESAYAAREQVDEYENWTLPALALPYADHPDYDPAWAPS